MFETQKEYYSLIFHKKKAIKECAPCGKSVYKKMSIRNTSNTIGIVNGISEGIEDE
jgi:hypothetical protein